MEAIITWFSQIHPVLADFNLNDYIKAGSSGGLTIDNYVHLLKFGPVDTVKTVFIEGFKTTKQDFKF